MFSVLASVPLAAFILYSGLLVVALAADHRSRINRAFAVYLLCMMLWSFASFAVRLRLLTDNPLLWGKVLAAGCIGLPISFYHFVRDFLGLKEQIRRLHAGYALYAVSILLTFATNWVVASARLSGSKYYLEPGLGGVIFVATWATVFIVWAIVALWRRYRQSQDPDYRNLIRYLWIGGAFALAGSAATRIPALRTYPIDIVGNSMNALFLAYCILRYQLLDLAPVLRGVLSYFLLFVIVGGGYLLSFLILIRLVYLFGTWVLWPAALSIILMILFLPPVRHAGQTLVDRLLSPQRFDVERMLQRLSSATGSIMDLRTLTRLILDEVTQTLKIKSACIFLRDADTGEFYLAEAKGLSESAMQMRWRPDHPVIVWLDREQKVLTRAGLNFQYEPPTLLSQEAANLDQLGAQLFVPLHVKDKLVGLFAVGPKLSAAPYTADEKRALTAAANQTVVAVENARLHATEQRRLNESLVLLDIASAIGSTLDLTQVLKRIAQRTAEACGAHRCSIFLLDEQKQRILPLMSQFASGKADAHLWEHFRQHTYLQRVEEVPLLARILRDRQPVVVDASNISSLPESWVVPFNICSLLAVPLLSRDSVIGVLVLDYVESGKHFGQDQINLAMTIASQAALAIQNARLFEQLKQRLQRLALLEEISVAVTSTLNLNDILRTTVAGLSKVFEVSQSGVIIFDEDQTVGRLVAEYPPGPDVGSVTIPLRGNLSVERILVTKQPLAIEDAQHDPLLASIRDLMRKRSVKSILIVPLLLKGEVIGTIGLDATKDTRTFTAEEIELAQAIANQISVAIENARLYQQTIGEKAKTEIILQETFSGIMLVDDRLRIVSLNPAAELITGYYAREALGKRIGDILGAEIAAPGSPLARAIETGEKVLPVETVLIGKAGSKDVLLGVTPLPSSEQAVAHYLLSLADISKLKEVERLKSSIVANVSHELRSPLASIKVYTELLLNTLGDSDVASRRAWLSVIERETDRLTALINDFLDLSRLESGRFALTKVPIHLERVIADVVDLLRVQAERRDIQIQVDVQPGLPQLWADKDLIASVVRNLLSNAIKFNREGGQVRITVQESDGDFQLCVEDEGIGIPQDAIPQLFTKFFRVPSAAAAGVQGTGLGLALTHEAVAAHGGRIQVESTLGKGSRFTVFLPRASPVAKASGVPETDKLSLDKSVT